MWLIPKGRSDPEDAGARIAPEVAGFIRKDHAAMATDVEAEAVSQLVHDAHLFGKWIACDCRQVEAVYPLMCPVLMSDRGTYYLRNLNAANRPLHHQGCELRIERASRRKPGKPNHSSGFHPLEGKVQILRAERTLPVAVGGEARPEQEPGGRSQSIPSLRRLLLTLLQKAGTHRLAAQVEGDEHKLTAQLREVSLAADELELGAGISLSQMLCTYLKAFESNRFYAQMRTVQKGGEWPNRRPLEGFVIAYAETIGEDWIDPLFGNRIQVRGRVKAPSIQGTTVTGPYVVIIHIGERSKKAGLEPLQAWAEPTYWKTLAPVDSEHEREMWKILKRVRYRALDAGRVQGFAIVKPIFDIDTDLGSCRPDFLIQAIRDDGISKTGVIEVMGLDGEDYEAAKSITHPRMAQLGDLLTFGTADLSRPRIDQELVDLVM